MAWMFTKSQMGYLGEYWGGDSSGNCCQKGDKELTIVENHGFVIGPLSVEPVNHHATVMLPETLTALAAFTDPIGIDLRGSAFTLAAAFDAQDNQELIKAHQMKPVIDPNRRHTKTPIVIARMFRWFDRTL